jgi:SnoaL-like domain
MISTEHLDAYLEAMGRRDVEGTKAHLADDVVIRSPIVPAPFQGKEQVIRVLDALLNTVDAFEPKLLLRDGADFVAVFSPLSPNSCHFLRKKSHQIRAGMMTASVRRPAAAMAARPALVR